MASSKVMASPTSVNSDLAHQNTTCSLTIPDLPIDQTKSFGSMSMDDLLKNIYGEIPPPPEDFAPATSVGGNTAKNADNKTVDQVWKEIVAGGGGDPVRTGVGDGFEEMTLEDFLTKAGAVREEDVRASVMQGQGNFGVEAVMNGHFQSPIPSQGVDGAIVPFGNGIEGGVVPAGGAGGRGKRRVVEEPVDKATQQKQRRMIKNRESAARSRERKQAYTCELESLVTQLEEENARLVREEAEQTKERFKQLLENLIPVVEKRRPPRVLRRVHSMCW